MWGRMFCIFLLLVNVFLGYHILFSPKDSLHTLLEFKDRCLQMQMELAELHKKNLEKSIQLRALKKHPEQLEIVIRDKFHYVRPGEVIYVHVPDRKKVF